MEYPTADTELFKLIQQDNERCFTIFVQKYQKQLIYYANSMLHNIIEAQDVVQDIFISIWNRRKEIIAHNMKHYLFKCVSNRCNLILIHNKVLEKRINKYSYTLVDSYTFKPFFRQELAQKIDKSLEKIPPAMRWSFISMYLQDKSLIEISKTQNISYQVVKNNISICLNRLRNDLKNNQKIFD